MDPAMALCGPSPALTAVDLEYRAEELNYRLLFGRPIHITTQLNTFGHRISRAWFTPKSLFGLDLWRGAPIRNAAGLLRTRTTARSCFVLETGTVGEVLERVPQVRPGARVLIGTTGQRRSLFFLAWLAQLKERCELLALEPEFFELKSIAIRSLIPERDRPEAIGFPDARADAA